MRALVSLLLITALTLLTGCSSDTASSPDAASQPPAVEDTEATGEADAEAEAEGEAEGEVVQVDVSQACSDSFAAAAAIGDLQDTVEDLDPALTACGSIEEWIAASSTNPGAIDGDPAQYLLNRCQYTEAPTGPACEEIMALYPDGLYITPYEELVQEDGS